MLKYQNWYIGIWLIVVLLYCQGWSSLNAPLISSLLSFFVASIFVTFFLSVFSSPVPLLKLRWVRTRKPLITIFLIAGFVADWAYRREIPIFNPYQGFDTSVTEQETMGIPVVHVVIIGLSIFYAMYLQYLFLSNTKQKTLLVELLSVLFLLLLNNSRGYVVFSLFVGVLLYAAFNKSDLLNTRASVIVFLVFGVLGIVFFISAAGNIRSGYSWNDCSYIEAIGYFDNYPSWLSKHFMWFYTYATSPLANLNLNCSLHYSNFDAPGLLYSFLPEQISNSYLLVNVKPAYIVQHLNACTGFATFSVAAGSLGLFVGFVGLVGYYSLIKVVLKKFVVLQTFGNALLCFLTIAFIFFNCFTTSALCYIPLFLIIASIYLHGRYLNGDIELINVN